MSADKDFIVGLANQDQELAGIRETWEKTGGPDRLEFIEALSDCLIHERALPFEDIVEQSAEWAIFVARCAAAGLRQALLQDEKA